MNHPFKIPCKENDFQGYMLFNFVVIWSSITCLIVLSGLFFLPNLFIRWIGFAVLSFLIGISSLILGFYFNVKFASWWFICTLWLLITLPCYTAGGIFAPGIITQVCVILTAGFLLNWKGGVFFGLLSVFIDLLFVYLEMNSLLPNPTVIHTPLTRWVGSIIPFGTIIALQYFSTNHLRRTIIALQQEKISREQVEKDKELLLFNLKERVKEMKTLYKLCMILQNDELTFEEQIKKIVNLIPKGWQYPQQTATRISIGNIQIKTSNFAETKYILSDSTITQSGETLKIEVVYLFDFGTLKEDPFLNEERTLLTTILNILKIEIERKEKLKEVKDYRYALDMSSLVSISDVDGNFLFVNENFCKSSKYESSELIGKHFSVLWSTKLSDQFIEEMRTKMSNGQPFSGEFLNRAKDGSLYWTASTITPFVNENGKVYQYLSINKDITKRKLAEEKIIKSERNLQKITSQVPGLCYMFELNELGEVKVLFVSQMQEDENIESKNYDNNLYTKLIDENTIEEDKNKIEDALKSAYKTKDKISIHFRTLVDGKIKWIWFQATPDLNSDENLVWYGTSTDITPIAEYISTIEQIVFDISHVMRRPITTIIGLINMIKDPEIEKVEFDILLDHLQKVCIELEKFTNELNQDYNSKRQNSKFNFGEINDLIDRRPSLFKVVK